MKCALRCFSTFIIEIFSKKTSIKEWTTIASIMQTITKELFWTSFIIYRW